jgi:hypothetical protein
MKMPGFSGEASLYKTARTYLAVATSSQRRGVTPSLLPRDGGNGNGCLADCADACSDLTGPAARACAANCRRKCSTGGGGGGAGGGGGGGTGASTCSGATAAFCGAVFVPSEAPICAADALLPGNDWCMCMMTASNQAFAGLPDCWPCVQQWFGC